MLDQQAQFPLIDARLRRLTVAELCQTAEESRAEAISTKTLWTVLARTSTRKWTDAKGGQHEAMRGVILIVPGTKTENWHKIHDLAHGEHQKVEMIGNKLEVRRAAVSLIPEQCEYFTVTHY